MESPPASSAAVAAVMRANRKWDTRPEKLVRSRLHQAGFRFRKHLALLVDDVSVRPDVVFTRSRVAVFVDGCFWHRCPEHGKTPRSHAEYWRQKLQRNEERDRRNDIALRRNGWVVLRFWEHEAPADVVAAIAATLRASADMSGRCG